MGAALPLTHEGSGHFNESGVLESKDRNGKININSPKTKHKGIYRKEKYMLKIHIEDGLVH